MILPLLVSVCAAFAPVQERAPSLVVYDVFDLLPKQHVPILGDLPLVGMSFRSAAAEPAPSAQQARERLAQAAEPREGEQDTAALGELVGRWMRPAFDGRVQQIRAAARGSLAVLAEPEQHAWLMDFLQRHRVPGVLVDLQAVWITGPKGAFQRLGIGGGATATLLTPGDVQRLLVLPEDERFERVSAPRLLVQPLQRGSLAIENPVSYVKGYKLEVVEPGPVTIVDPDIDSVMEGIELGALAVLAEQGRLAIDLELVTTALKRPIATKKVRLVTGDEREYEVATPEVTRMTVRTRCLLADGATAAFATPSSKPERDLLVMLTAKRVEPVATDNGAVPPR